MHLRCAVFCTIIPVEFVYKTCVRICEFFFLVNIISELNLSSDNESKYVHMLNVCLIQCQYIQMYVLIITHLISILAKNFFVQYLEMYKRMRIKLIYYNWVT